MAGAEGRLEADTGRNSAAEVDSAIVFQGKEMNTHDIDIKLPAEFQSGNDIPVKQATIKRERMEEIIQDAIESAMQSQIQDEALSKAKYALMIANAHAPCPLYAEAIETIEQARRIEDKQCS